jgi:hypothetical protein
MSHQATAKEIIPLRVTHSPSEHDYVSMGSSWIQRGGKEDGLAAMVPAVAAIPSAISSLTQHRNYPCHNLARQTISNNDILSMPTKRTAIVPHSLLHYACQLFGWVAVVGAITLNCRSAIVPGTLGTLDDPYVAKSARLTVDAGPKQVLSTTSTTVLAKLAGKASGSGIAGGKTICRWTKVSGPGEAIFSDSARLDSLVRLTGTGDFVLRLTAHYGNLTRTDDCTITVIQFAVSAGPDQTIEVGYGFSLPATASLRGTVKANGLIGQAPANRWTQRSGPRQARIVAPTDLRTPIWMPAEGTYVFRLESTYGGKTQTDQVSVTLKRQRRPPAIGFLRIEEIWAPSLPNSHVDQYLVVRNYSDFAIRFKAHVFANRVGPGTNPTTETWDVADTVAARSTFRLLGKRSIEHCGATLFEADYQP